MERLTRKPFQGVTNIIRFNWHFYVLAFVIIIPLFFAKRYFNYNLNVISTWIIFFSILSILISLFVSWYIYDSSDLYSLNWLDFLKIENSKQLININAGFDETSWRLKEKFNTSNLDVLDFYDSKKHTEISIERARKIYSVFPGTKKVSTDNISLQQDFADYIFLIFAAHEIRSDDERIIFFKQFKNVLKDDGKIIIVEHVRDIYNFIAYNIGFMHFLSNKTWEETFSKSGLVKKSVSKLNPFVSIFILEKNGIAS